MGYAKSGMTSAAITRTNIFALRERRAARVRANSLDKWERKEAYTWSEKAAGSMIVELAETNLTCCEDLQAYLLESFLVGYISLVCARVSTVNRRQHNVSQALLGRTGQKAVGVSFASTSSRCPICARDDVTRPSGCISVFSISATCHWSHYQAHVCDNTVSRNQFT
jgi:hypothetical protein